MSLKKQYLKSKDICKVTFKLPKEAAPKATEVTLVGDFNGWDEHSCPMKKLKNGAFTVNVDLPRGKEYQFRYRIDHKSWENDWEADRYVPSGLGEDNSVVVIS